MLELGVSESTHFVGMVPNTELPSLLSSGDVYVSTSLSDGTSISLLEALSCGLAPVVTDIPANRPWVIDGSDGSLFPAGDYQALAAKITTALKDNDMRTRFGEAGRRLVLEKADFRKEMAKIERLYEEIKGAGA